MRWVFLPAGLHLLEILQKMTFYFEIVDTIGEKWVKIQFYVKYGIWYVKRRWDQVDLGHYRD